MTTSVIVVGIFGIFSFVGGIIGFVKAKSKASLAAGLVSGLVLLVSSFLISAGNSWGAILSLAVALALGGRFLGTWLKNHRVMPDLVMVILSLITLIAVGWEILKLFRFLDTL